MKSHTLSTGRSPRLLAIALTAAALAPTPAVAQHAGPPDYSAYTQAAFLPFVHLDRRVEPFTQPVMLEFWINGVHFDSVTMDTGSTGLQVAGAAIGLEPDAALDTTSLYLSSSGWLFVGRWVPQEVTFRDALMRSVVVNVPVLAVSWMAQCSAYDSAYNRGLTCARGDTAKWIHPLHHRYMGVGFGREHDGQGQSTPDKNPFLHVVSIDGQAMRDGAMRRGYVVTAEGVHLGLTARNTVGFAYDSLKRDTTWNDWQGAPACVSVGTDACASGFALADTGLDEMFLSLPGIPDTVRMLPAESKVTVTFPGVAYYTFKVGDLTNPLQPRFVRHVHDETVFVNTGRHFFRRFDVLFDYDGGLYGLKWTGPADDPNGGMLPGAR